MLGISGSNSVSSSKSSSEATQSNIARTGQISRNAGRGARANVTIKGDASAALGGPSSWVWIVAVLVFVLVVLGLIFR